MSAGGTVVLVGFEPIARGFTAVQSFPADARLREAPDEERPDAFIRWGQPSQFDFDWRSQVSDPGGTTFEFPFRPIHGDYQEEGRKWEDVKITNPENEDQTIIVPVANPIAFSAPPYRMQDPRKGYEHNYIVMTDQVTLEFERSYDAHGKHPVYLKATDGREFEPFVLTPFQWIKEVGWPALEFFLIYMMFENSSPECFLELKNPDGKNINTWGGLGLDGQGNPINAGDLIKDDHGNPILDEQGNEQHYFSSGDLKTIPLAVIAEGEEGSEPNSGGGWREVFEEQPYPFTGVYDLGYFGLPRMSLRGNTTVIVGPGNPGSTGHPEIGQITPEIQAFMDRFHISGLGSDGELMTTDGQPWGGGAIKAGDSPPTQMRLTVGTLFSVHGYDTDFDTFENIPWIRSSTNGIIPNASFYRANIYMYSPWRPAFTIEHDLAFKWWIGYINASLLWKMFRSTYTGAEQLGNIPEPIEVKLFAQVPRPEPGDPDNPPGLTRARWSWHQGQEALDKLKDWDRDIHEHSHEGGGGEGGPG